MERVQEIHIQTINQDTVIERMIATFPSLQLYYYPGKLASLVTRDESGEYTFTFDVCIQILRQVLRAAGYKVRTRTVRKNNVTDKIIIIIPSVMT
jgi:hypothetical protein